MNFSQKYIFTLYYVSFGKRKTFWLSITCLFGGGRLLYVNVHYLDKIVYHYYINIVYFLDESTSSFHTKSRGVKFKLVVLHFFSRIITYFIHFASFVSRYFGLFSPYSAWELSIVYRKYPFIGKYGRHFDNLCLSLLYHLRFFSFFSVIL